MGTLKEPPSAAGASSLAADPDVLLDYRSARAGTSPLTVGHDATLRSGTVLYSGSRIGDRFQTGHHVVVREDCLIGDDVSIWSNTVVDYSCRIGDRVKIHANCYVAQYTEIMEDAFLAPGVSIANDLYPGLPESAAVMSGPRIGVGAQLGVNVTVLPYVRIGDGCLVGAGSVVTRDLPAGTVAYGSPARVRGLVAHLPDIGTRVAEDPVSAARFRLATSTSADRTDSLRGRDLG
jgi:acetyltransferase-like isoleucine patch superfamily enzyme